MKLSFLNVSALAFAAVLSLTAGTAQAGRGAHNVTTTEAGTTTGTAVSSASGTIVQANYNDQGVVDGFVVDSSTLLKFPGRVCGGATTLGAVGQAVTYSGTAYTNATTGITAVRVSALTNTTTSATYTAPTAPTSTAYAATDGSITRLNFDAAGGINGVLFTPSGSTAPVLVKFGGAVRDTTLTPLLVVGAAVNVVGTTTTGETYCGTAAVSTVRATSLTIGGTVFTFSAR